MLIYRSRPCLGSVRCLRSFPARYISKSRSQPPPSPSTSPSPSPSSASPPPRNRTSKLPFELGHYWDTTPPTAEQLKHADKYFTREPPSFLWSAPNFRDMEIGAGTPEVCFLGRSNVGKSSLLNALMGKEIARSSVRPGFTKLMNAFAVGDKAKVARPGPDGLVVMDMPGYGKGAQAEWGVQITRYLEKRTQLKRVFLLINAGHGVKDTDKQVIQLLQDLKVPFQVVLSKIDRVLVDGKKNPEKDLSKKSDAVRDAVEMVKQLVQPYGAEDDGCAVGEVIACASKNGIGGKTMGIDRLRFAVLRAAGWELPVFKPVELGDGEIVSFEAISAMQTAGLAVGEVEGEREETVGGETGERR